MDLIPIALCQPSDVKLLIDAKLSGNADNLLIQIINGISQAIEAETSRLLEKKVYTEFFNGEDGCKRIVIVQAPPIVDDVNLAVYDDPTMAYTETTKLTPNVDYFVPNAGHSGIIKLTNNSQFKAGYKNIKVQYYGGLVRQVTDPSNDIDVPPDLRHACALQASYLYKIRDNVGLQSLTTNTAGTAVFYTTPTRWLPAVKDIIDSYRHFLMT
jgi:hypothetical protein